LQANVLLFFNLFGLIFASLGFSSANDLLGLGMTDINLSLIVVSDTICPWCFIGKARLQQAIAMLPENIKVSLRFEPYLLNPEMPLKGLTRKDYRTQKFGSWEKSLELDAQVEAAAKQSGVQIYHELMQRTPNSILSHAMIAVS
jgi:predicted DsbA family dithiol-disulfide isomerase